MQIRMIVALLVWLVSRVATAEVVVDQQNLGSCCSGYILDYQGDYIAQTFTANNSGMLVGVGVQVALSGASNDAPVTDDLHVTLMRTDGSGAPAAGEILASRVISRYVVPASTNNVPMIDLDFSSAGLNVHAGDVLAIALSSNHTYYSYPRSYMQYSWKSVIGNPHPGGAFYIYSPLLYGPTPHLVSDFIAPPNNTRDMGFRVLIDTPEPSSIAMVVPLLGLLLLRCSRVRYVTASR